MVRLTPRGLALEGDFNEISKLLQNRVYQGFTDLEKEILVRLLMRIKGNFESP
jgi:hypothetical protein